MAIEKNIELQSGLLVNNAYIRVDTISGFKGLVTISVNSYKSRRRFLEGSSYLEQKFYEFEPDTNQGATEMWTQCYNYLKSTEEYEGAVDIFEDDEI